MSSAAARDPVLFELFKNAVHAIADEMALTVVRTTYSGVLKDNMDFSTAFCAADGRLVAQGLTLPGHLGSIPSALGAVIDRYGDNIREGDVYCLNDSFMKAFTSPSLPSSATMWTPAAGCRAPTRRIQPGRPLHSRQPPL